MAHDSTTQALDATKPEDAALLALLAAVAFADGEVDDGEVQFLKRVLPGRTEAALRQWAKAAGARPLKLDAIALALPGTEDRWRALRFTVRMAWKDGSLHPVEREVLNRLCVAFELPTNALDRALAELSGRSTATVTPFCGATIAGGSGAEFCALTKNDEVTDQLPPSRSGSTARARQ